ncbi:MAG: hypothetical protein E6J21_02110 [Chloroflexota bacterium]|nr:MAG: hypothetical protein E6J21_02110 [Chloroflexota bacterium]
MDQQEFAPRSQSEEQQPLEEEGIEPPAEPYYWSSRPNTPKDEPTALYDVPMVQSDSLNDYQNGYMARKTVEDAENTESQRRKQQFSPDGDAYEFQYRPNWIGNQQRGAPPFARPQLRRRNPARWFWLVVLGLIFIGPLMHVLGVLLATIGVIILVLFLTFLLVLLVAIPFILFSVGRRLGLVGNRRRGHFSNSWRGPWGW